MSAAGFYHCSAKGVGRANGRSVVAAAAYRSGERLIDAISGQTFDYRARGGVAETFILTRDDAPAWAHDRERLWNEAERATVRANARIANEFVLALPHELDAAQRRELVKEFLAPLIDKYGVAVDVAIHEPGRGRDSRNHHAHVLVTHRELGPEGFGEIANTRVMARKRDGKMVEERVSGIIAAVPDVFALRKNWEQAVNRAYERAGLDIRVDHRSHDDRGLDEKPTIHLGPAAAEIERRKPGASELGDINRKIVADNDNRRKLAALEAEERKLNAQIIDLKAERAMREARVAAKGRYDMTGPTPPPATRDPSPGRFDDLKAATPPPEIVRQFEANARRATEPDAPIWDRDTENTAWEAKLADSAKDAAEARQRPSDRADADLRPETSGPSGDQQNRPAAEDTRPLGKTAAEILMAWTLSRSAEQFEEALAAKGISLAAVSRDEAEQSQRTAAFAKEVGSFARILKAGEIVAVNEHGNVHRLNQRTTGEPSPDIEARFPGIDRATLLNVADTKDVLQEAARAAYRDEARETRDINTPLTGIETAIAEALTNTMTGTEFAAAIDDAGLTITRATDTDVMALDVLRQEEAEARETILYARTAHHFASLAPNDYAAVTRSGDVFRLNPTAFDIEEMEQRLADVQARLPSVIEARAQNEITRENTAEFWAELRAWNAEAGVAREEGREGDRALHDTVAAGERAVEVTLDTPADAIEEGLHTASRFGKGLAKAVENILGGIFSFFGASEPKLTPLQAELAARANEELTEARAAFAEIQAQDAEKVWIIFQQDRQQQQEEMERETGYRERPGDRERERERY